MRKIILTSLAFLIIGILLILVYHYLFPAYYVKGTYLLNPNESKSINIPYYSFIFEYKDNNTQPLKISFQSVSISKYSENNSIFYYYGNSYDGSLEISNNYTTPILLGYVIADDTPLLFLFPVLFYLGIILVILGVLILIVDYIFF